MSRNIVLLSDGTGNSAAKVWRTNVWRTFEQHVKQPSIDGPHLGTEIAG